MYHSMYVYRNSSWRDIRRIRIPLVTPTRSYPLHFDFPSSTSIYPSFFLFLAHPPRPSLPRICLYFLNFLAFYLCQSHLILKQRKLK